MHGIAQVAENFLNPKKTQIEKSRDTYLISGTIKKMIKIGVVFSFVTFLWIFFRANSIGEAVYFFTHMFAGLGKPVDYLKSGIRAFLASDIPELPVVLMIIILASYDYMSQKVDVIEKIGQTKAWIRWPLYLLFILLIMYFMPIQSSGEFIYFQF